MEKYLLPLMLSLVSSSNFRPHGLSSRYQPSSGYGREKPKPPPAGTKLARKAKKGTLGLWV